MTKGNSLGVCELCGMRKGKAAMVTHLKQCLTSSAKSDATMPVMLLRVQSGNGSIHWLNAAVGWDGRLKELDSLLRRVWLECCGHLSEFYTTGRRKLSMSSRMTEVFGSIGDRVNYVYDFGSSTELVVSFAGVAGGTSGKPVVLARNEAPVWPCDVCGQPAADLCSNCEYEGTGFFCIAHRSGHECGEDMLLPVVNSPRMGVCGYTGEA